MPQVTIQVAYGNQLRNKVIKDPTPEQLKAYAEAGVPFRLSYGAGSPLYPTFTSR